METYTPITFEDIINFKIKNSLQGETILQLIVAYCEKHNLDALEVGEDLKKDKKFVEVFKADLINHNEASFEDVKKPSTEEWF